MAVPRRPAPVNEVDLEQTAELPVIDFTGTHAEISSSDATISVAALTMDDTLARTDTYAVPSLAGATAMADNLRDVEERLHRKAERVAALERDVDALRTDAEARLAALRATTDDELAKLRADHEAALREAQDAAAEANRKLTQTSARLDETQERLSALETRAGQQVASLSGQEKELAARARRIEELQQEFTQASGLARELGQARDGFAERARSLEQSLSERTSTLDRHVSELATAQSRLASIEAERSRLLIERDDLRGTADRQLEALHRLEAYRGVAEALIGERDVEIWAREADIAQLRTELKQLAERDERIAVLEGSSPRRARGSLSRTCASALCPPTVARSRVAWASSTRRWRLPIAARRRRPRRCASRPNIPRRSRLSSRPNANASRSSARISTKRAARRARSWIARDPAPRPSSMRYAPPALPTARSARAAAASELEAARREAASERDRLQAEAVAASAARARAHDA